MPNSIPRIQVYYWKAKHHSGKLHFGQCFAISQHDVIWQLEQKQLVLVQIKPSKISKLYSVINQLNAHDIALFTQQLASLLQANITLSDALKLLHLETKQPIMKAYISHMSLMIAQGLPLSQSLPSPPFNALYCECIANGELTGHLPAVLTTLSQELDEKRQRIQNLKSTLSYPCLLLIVTFTVSYLMLTKVIPEFEQLFTGFSADLPWFTQSMIHLSHTFSSYWHYFIMTLLGIFLLPYLCYHCHRHSRLKISQFMCHLPIIGSIGDSLFMIRFSQIMATSIQAGIPFLTALERCIVNTPSLYRQQKLTKVRQSIKQGTAIFDAMKGCQLFSNQTLQLMLIAQESGQLEQTFSQLHTIYKNTLNQQLNQLKSTLEPCLILILGGLVASLVIAMYLPIFNLTNVLG